MMKKLLSLLLLLLPLGAIAQDAASYSIISYNIRNSSAGDGSNAWNLRRQATLNMVNAEQPDLIGTQEVLLDQKKYLKQNLSDYKVIGVGRDDGHRVGECMAILVKKSRFKVLKSGTLWLSETPEKVSFGWDGACRRTVTWVKVRDKKTRQELYYFNTHLDHVGKIARREAVLLLCDIIDKMVPAGVPVILGGDLNSDIRDNIFRPLEAHGLAAAREITAETSHLNTYNGFGSGSGVIDHFFIRGIEPHRFATLNGDYGATYISDHYPIRLDFDIRR